MRLPAILVVLLLTGCGGRICGEPFPPCQKVLYHETELPPEEQEDIGDSGRFAREGQRSYTDRMAH